MKINGNRLPVTKKSLLQVCFFACMFVFASFTKEDRQKVREFKKDLISKWTHKNGVIDVTNSSKKQTHLSAKSNSVTGAVSNGKIFLESEKEILLDNNSVYVSSFLSREKEGTIGTFTEKEEDKVFDNFFTVDIPSIDKENTSVYLEYDLFGLASHQSVSRSINHNIAIGGDVIVPSTEWSHQREKLKGDIIKNGLNTILFTSPAEGVKYKIKNLKIIFDKNKRSDNLIVNSLLSNDQLYVKGSGVRTQDFKINNESVAIKNGEFEKVISLSKEDLSLGMFSVTFNGITNNYKIPNKTNAYKIQGNNNYFVPRGITVSNEIDLNIDYEGTNIKVEKETSESAYLEVLKLRSKDYPATSNGLKNVTLNNSAFRLSILSGTLKKKIKLTIPYDEKRLGLISPKENKAFYFDYAKKQWIVDKSAVVDTKNKTVTVESDGDNDYINGIISVPESPQTNAFAPTSISGLKAGDPTAGLQLMEVPTANQKGDANLNYPIRVPSGIGGLQPSVSISYNSGGGNGWMGDGWNINGISAISVDTRWGVPVFESEKETELYSLDGEMLVYPTGYLPHRHNDVSESNPAITTGKQLRSSYLSNGIKQFYMRKNHDFTLIERIGTSPGNYTWKVTSTDGTKSYYGGTPDSVIYSDGGIAHWALRLVEDPHGNTMEYTYYNEAVSQGQASVSGGLFFQIKKIAYGKAKEYTVNFNKETSITRKDISINAKQGIKRVEPYLLKDIEVKYKNEKIRIYKFDYINGEFSKTLLSKLYIVPYNPCSTTVMNKDSENPPIDNGSGGGGGSNGGIDTTECNEITDSYAFEYYDDVKDNQGNIRLFGPDTHIQVENDRYAYSSLIRGLVKPSKINGNISSEKGLNIRPAAGLNFFTPNNDPFGHLMFGFPFSSSDAEAKNAQQLIDFNGDGIQDMIYRVPDTGLFFRAGSLDTQGNLSFLSSQPIQNYGGEFSFTKTSTFSSGWDMGAVVYSKSHINTKSSGITSAYLIDANADGLVDIVNDGRVWFNKFNKDSKISEMTEHSEYTENMVLKLKPVQPQPPILNAEGYVIPEENYSLITDVVKVWIAPKDGYVKFKDLISVSGTPNDPTQKFYYSVEILDPANSYSVNGRIYLNGLQAGGGAQHVLITKYNDYLTQMESIPDFSGGINNSNRLFVRSGDKIYVRLHKNTSESVTIESDPIITYVDPVTGAEIPNSDDLSQDSFYLNNGSYSDNFFLNNLSSPIYLDVEGPVTVQIPSIYFSSITDSFTFKVVTEDKNTGVITQILSQVYTPGGSFSTSAESLSFNVYPNNPVYLRFIVESDSHTDFLASNWNGKILVNYAPTNPQINLSYSAVPEYPSFAVTQLKSKLNINTIPNQTSLSGNHNFGVEINKNITNFSSLGTGTFYYVIRKGNQTLAKRMVIVSHSDSYIKETDIPSGQDIVGISPINFYFGAPDAMSNLDVITIQVYCKTGGDYDLYNKYSQYFQGKPFNIYYDGSNWYGNTFATAVNTGMYNTKTAISKNWGQFILNLGNLSNYTFYMPIPHQAFSSNASTQSIYPLCQGITSNADLAACILNSDSNPNASNNTISSNVSPMKPLVERNGRDYASKWVGIGPEQNSMAYTFKNDDNTNYFSNPIPSLPVIVPTTLVSPQISLDTTMKAINKIQKSSSQNITEGLNAGMGSAGNSITQPTQFGSVELQTFTDMNGDGYPDLLYRKSIQATNSLGSLEDIQELSVERYPSQTHSYLKMNSLGFSSNVFSVSGRIEVNGSSGTSTTPDNSMPWSAGATASAGINQYFDSTDYGKEFIMDINGDGLPDRIKQDPQTLIMKYELNKGKSFESERQYENLIPYRSHPKGSASIGIGGSLGSSVALSSLSNFGFGITANAGASASLGTADTVFEDVNGDGLIDILEVYDQNGSNNSTAVKYNLGSKFASAVPLVKATGNLDFTDETRSYNSSISFGGSFFLNIGPITIVPIFPILILYIKAGLGATANLGLNVSDTKKAFKDMNGDGFVDLVEDTDNGFNVNYSLVGRTNKLRSVTNTISKGKYIIDYEFARANYESPHAKLVVKKVNVVEPNVFSQNYTKEQGISMETRYSFSNRKYDRREREDFGFETVTKEFINNNGVERTSTDIYFNNTYLLNGLIKKNIVRDGGGNNISMVDYFYKLRKFKNNITEIDFNTDLSFDYDSGGKEGRRMAIALLDKKIKKVYETGGDITVEEKFSYAPKGMIKKYEYISPSVSYNSNITYQSFNNNIIGVPVLVEVYEGTSSSVLLRRRRAYNINPNTGDVGTYAIFNGSADIVTDIEYNAQGNVKKVIYPPNEALQRYSLTYTYDDLETGKYLIRVEDSFQLASSAIYNPFFDVVTRTVDTGGNAMVYYYDGFGRVKSIMGPNEIASGSTVPTVSYRYWTDHAGIPNNDATVKIYRASTSNYDPEYAGSNNTIMTDTYADFLGRVVQVKKDIELNGTERRSVSGRTIYDRLGRAIQQFHPIDEPTSFQNLNSIGGQVPFTLTTYDSRDRIIAFTDEDGHTTETSYTIESGFLKTTTTLLNEKSESYANAEGKIIRKNNYLDTQAITTNFEYNTIGELVNVYDPEGFVTNYSYDLAGRRIQQIHPDKGQTDYEYDMAGNLIKFTTANLMNNSTGNPFIKYIYEQNRLKEIRLPDVSSGPNPNNVLYEYGNYNVGNNSGKLIAKYDGTGHTNYQYGRMGEVILEERFVYGYQIPDMYFKTYFNYDSWNRLKRMDYPDGEIVLYHYDRGGNLKSVNNNNGEVYIHNIQYDLYEQKTGIQNGNGTKQWYSYGPSRKLIYHGLQNASNDYLLNNTYEYDGFSNITQIRNTAQQLGNGLGGMYEFNFMYDTLNRLIGTDTTKILVDGENQPIPVTMNVPSSFKLEMYYNDSGSIARKIQYHENDQQVVSENSYENNYNYSGQDHKVMEIIDQSTGNVQTFEYDYNGNPTIHHTDSGDKSMFWDEQDRMKAFYDDHSGFYQYNVYDDKGERTIKYRLEVPATLYQNGAILDTGSFYINEYKIYPNSYVVVNSNGQYTKNYFTGSTRFASRVLDGADIFVQSSTVRTQSPSGNKSNPDVAADFKTYLEKAGIESKVSLDLASVFSTYGQPGLYYLHGDHLGTATFVTDQTSESTQFFINLPFGETMLEQQTGLYDNPYKFNAKELDSETGLYYYGARYYNPRLSIWYGVDPLAEKYPSWSPYNYTLDNPIIYTDPDGRSPLTDYKLGRNGKVERIDKNDGSDNNLHDRLYAVDKSGKISKSFIRLDKESKESSTIISKLESQNMKSSQIVQSSGKDLRNTINIFQFASLNSDVEWSAAIGSDWSNAIATSNKIVGTPFLGSYVNDMFLDIHSHRGTAGPSDAHTRFNTDGTPYQTGDKIAPHNSTTRRFIYYVGDSGAASAPGTLYQFGKGLEDKKDGIRIGGFGGYKERNTLYERLIRTPK